MTREEWKRYEQVAHKPDVRFAMGARCEEQGDEWENCCSIMMRIYQQCKWCGQQR